VCLVILTVRFLGVRRGKKRGEGVGPRPKPLPQASKNGLYEKRIGVVGEKGLKNVDVYRRLDGEKVCVRSDRVICNCVFQLRFGRPWKWDCRLRPLSGSHGLLVVCSPQVVPSIFGLKTLLISSVGCRTHAGDDLLHISCRCVCTYRSCRCSRSKCCICCTSRLI
jgi:hypothetical protein